jgi:hypothetical protein
MAPLVVPYTGGVTFQSEPAVLPTRRQLKRRQRLYAALGVAGEALITLGVAVGLRIVFGTTNMSGLLL